MTYTAEKTGVSLTLFIDPALPEVLLGDPGRLRQILLNLIANAIKFSGSRSQSGQVSVRVTLANRDAEQATLIFLIQDNGIGMDAATLARLFTAFSQADASTTRRFGGTGLGLAISRQLATLMGGDIEALSKPGQGSTFRVRIPFIVPTAEELPLYRKQLDADAQESAPKCMTGAHLSSATACFKGGRILIAEDNEINRWAGCTDLVATRWLRFIVDRPAYAEHGRLRTDRRHPVRRGVGHTHPHYRPHRQCTADRGDPLPAGWHG
jgi:hypothetical protein